MKTVDEFSPSAEGRAGSVVSVLVVDDEAAVRRFACRVLERAGYGVFEAMQHPHQAVLSRAPVG